MAAQSGRSNENVVIDVQSSLVSSLNVELRDACISMHQSYCIFNIPSILFRHNESSFLPNCFSIGPMHRGKQHLVAVEKIKLKYLKGLLCRVNESKQIEEQKVLSDLVNAVNSIEKQASACYAGHDFAEELGDEFVKTMLLDGVFLIELFRRGVEQEKETDDPIFSMSCMLQYLHHDLILLENQIPWLVLETLFEKTRIPCENKSTLIKHALSFFANTFTSDQPKTSCFKEGQEIKHILDLLRLSLVLPSQENKNKPKAGWQPIRSATRLKEAGINFKKGEADSVLDIKFKDGCVEIPPLLIQETTETIFRNLIAYEQCLPHCLPIFTCYAKLLDGLIDTNDDMEILCKRDIFDNWLGLEDSTKFFNNLYNDTYVKEFYYSELSDKLDDHCRTWWPRWRAALVHNYFTKPWAMVALVYAVIMFGLTLWQAIK
ncbi:putative Calcium-binding EF-hand family protein [Hibiscus syriacus]|uniref:Calcium-binding EF-hand family protein n=1 Tax=Hibiscus syriacus TaxID=106335 RepID=A0A6A3BKK1_HIBSY|nr:UPF0481 protein At3g47200-like [Hibiscus syriacus]KAE8717103.1 putative Calcium-binding EF-hand family protein [Hibiscus syriacus]